MISRDEKKPVHVVGIKGIPGSYGGFETLAQQLVESSELADIRFTVYCEEELVPSGASTYLNARLIPLTLRATGWQSIFYDVLGIFKASRSGAIVLILGTSATIFLPIFKLLFPATRYIVNMAGLEWSRKKWGFAAKLWLKANERSAAYWSDVLIADNRELVKYVRRQYGVEAVFIPYGGDQSVLHVPEDRLNVMNELPASYDLAVARAQPDNNVLMILNAYASIDRDLVFLSNWKSTNFGLEVYKKYSQFPNLHLLDAIYDQATLLAIKMASRLYVHGHSAGGTNPVLVEMMNSRLPVCAFDVCFNRSTTEDQAIYFRNKDELQRCLLQLSDAELKKNAENMKKIADEKYTWQKIALQYKAILT